MSEFKFAVNESARIVFRHYEFRADREFAKVAYLKARHERIADILNGRSDYFAGIITAAEVIKELGIVPPSDYWTSETTVARSGRDTTSSWSRNSRDRD